MDRKCLSWMGPPRSSPSAIDAVGVAPNRGGGGLLEGCESGARGACDRSRRISSEQPRGFHLDVEIDFEGAAIGRQRRAFDVGPEVFRREIGRARTFGFVSDVKKLWQAGFALGSSLENSVAIDGEAILNPEGLRYCDEFVRHKGARSTHWQDFCLWRALRSSARIKSTVRAIRSTPSRCRRCSPIASLTRSSRAPHVAIAQARRSGRRRLPGPPTRIDVIAVGSTTALFGVRRAGSTSPRFFLRAAKDRTTFGAASPQSAGLLRQVSRKRAPTTVRSSGARSWTRLMSGITNTRRSPRGTFGLNE